MIEAMSFPASHFPGKTPGALIARAGISIASEQAEKLALYQARLAHWQKAINLVAASTLEDSARRHFLDSAQISQLLPAPEGGRSPVLVDMGSGAGFPGLVLAILRPDLNVHLVESDAKKCAFLQTISRETGSPVQIYNARIEDVWHMIEADIVTARALSTLSILLGYASPWFARKDGVQGVFLKGREAAREIEEARARWSFEVESIPSVSDSGGWVVQIRGVREKMSCG